MTEVVYSTQRVSNLGDRKILNPVHFVRPEDDVTVVYVQEGYQKVVDAYERVKGVKILPLSALPAGGSAATPPPPAKKEK